MTDKEFLYWIAERFVCVYNESPNVDFIHKLKKIADNLEKNIKDAYKEGFSDGKYGP